MSESSSPGEEPVSPQDAKLRSEMISSLNSECESGYDETPSECDIKDVEEEEEEQLLTTTEVENFTDEGRESVETEEPDELEEDDLSASNGHSYSASLSRDSTLITSKDDCENVHTRLPRRFVQSAKPNLHTPVSRAKVGSSKKTGDHQDRKPAETGKEVADTSKTPVDTNRKKSPTRRQFRPWCRGRTSKQDQSRYSALSLSRTTSLESTAAAKDSPTESGLKRSDNREAGGLSGAKVHSPSDRKPLAARSINQKYSARGPPADGLRTPRSGRDYVKPRPPPAPVYERLAHSRRQNTDSQVVTGGYPIRKSQSSVLNSYPLSADCESRLRKPVSPGRSPASPARKLRSPAGSMSRSSSISALSSLKSKSSKDLDRPKTSDSEPFKCSRDCGRRYTFGSGSRTLGRTKLSMRGKPLQLWEIQRTLGRGDYIEGVLNLDFNNGSDSFICAPITLGRSDGHLHGYGCK